MRPVHPPLRVVGVRVGPGALERFVRAVMEGDTGTNEPVSKKKNPETVKAARGRKETYADRE